MNEATPEELHNRYRELNDDELLVLAAESSELTPAAAAALQQELIIRKLREDEIADTRTTLQLRKAEEDEYNAAFFDRRRQISSQLITLAHVLVLSCLWFLIGIVVRWLCDSSRSATRFQTVVFLICAVPYAIWQLIVGVKKARRKILDSVLRASQRG